MGACIHKQRVEPGGCVGAMGMRFGVDRGFWGKGGGRRKGGNIATSRVFPPC